MGEKFVPFSSLPDDERREWYDYLCRKVRMMIGSLPDDPFGPDPHGHICSTYNIYNPRPGECPSHGEGWRDQRLYCHEHREWHEPGEAHDECEACEVERNEQRIVSEDEVKERWPSGAVCDGHLWEEEESGDPIYDA